SILTIKNPEECKVAQPCRGKKTLPRRSRASRLRTSGSSRFCEGNMPSPRCGGFASNRAHYIQSNRLTAADETHPLEYATSAEPATESPLGRNLIIVTVGRVALLGLWFLGGLLIAR